MVECSGSVFRGFLKSSLCALWSEQSQTNIREMLYDLVILRALGVLVVDLTIRLVILRALGVLVVDLTIRRGGHKGHHVPRSNRDFCNSRLLRNPLKRSCESGRRGERITL